MHAVSATAQIWLAMLSANHVKSARGDVNSMSGVMQFKAFLVKREVTRCTRAEVDPKA